MNTNNDKKNQCEDQGRKRKIFSAQKNIQTLFFGKFEKGFLSDFFNSAIFDTNTLKIIMEFASDYQQIIIQKELLLSSICIVSNKICYFGDNKTIRGIDLNTLKKCHEITIEEKITRFFNDSNRIYVCSETKLFIFSLNWELLGKILTHCSSSIIRTKHDYIYIYNTGSKMMQIYDQTYNEKYCFMSWELFMDFFVCDHIYFYTAGKMCKFTMDGVKISDHMITKPIIRQKDVHCRYILNFLPVAPFIFGTNGNTIVVYDKKFKIMKVVDLSKMLPELVNGYVKYHYDYTYKKLYRFVRTNHGIQLAIFPIKKILEDIELIL